MSFDRQKIEKRLGYTFQDEKLLKRAFTHSSLVNEQKELAYTDCNERLEFLGDTLLNFTVSEKLFKQYPSEKEKGLTDKRKTLVSENPLAEAAKALTLQEFLMTGKSVADKELPSILSDLFESVIAAIYLDGGMREAANFIERFLTVKETAKDYKSRLLEHCQKHKITDFRFETHEEINDNEKFFTAAFVIGDKLYGKGKGKTKKLADQEAAENTLKNLK